jgi:hypothetical protein
VRSFSAQGSRWLFRSELLSTTLTCSLASVPAASGEFYESSIKFNHCSKTLNRRAQDLDETLPVLTASFDASLKARCGNRVHALPWVIPEQSKDVRSLHALRARVIGTVTTRDNVESSNMDADSACIALYFAANRTTAVARGKLQQTCPAGEGPLHTNHVYADSGERSQNHYQ